MLYVIDCITIMCKGIYAVFDESWLHAEMLGDGALPYVFTTLIHHFKRFAEL